MSITLKKLCTENGNPFKLTLLAGGSSFRNYVSWAYVFEDEYLIRYLHGSEIVVTTGIQQLQNPDWLMSLTRKIADHKAAGLIVNTGNFIKEVPQDVIDYCEAHDFPLLCMPWEIHTTDLIQTFCTHIIFSQQEDVLHDNALRDAILGKDNVVEYTDILAKYYDLEGTFIIIMIYTTYFNGIEVVDDEDIEYRFINKIKKLKTMHHLSTLKVGLIKHDDVDLLCLNGCPKQYLENIRDILFDVYREPLKAGTLFTGMGNEVKGLAELPLSYNRALTALRMAENRSEPFVRFEDMGFYKILFSVRDDSLLNGYASEILAPLDEYDRQGHNYTELLKTYIKNDRSLEKTAADLYIHRNTVNYQIQKLKTILDNPLKTIDDLFPFKVALAIRDMEKSSERKI